MTFRKVLFWCHLATGVSAGVVILIMSVTGGLLAYEKQIIAWADTRDTRSRHPRRERNVCRSRASSRTCPSPSLAPRSRP